MFPLQYLAYKELKDAPTTAYIVFGELALPKHEQSFIWLYNDCIKAWRWFLVNVIISKCLTAFYL